MNVLALLLVAFVQPEDESTYYGMDMVISQFSPYWEEVYETSFYGLRTSQGCHDMRHWYQIYEAKSQVDFARFFSLRYRFFMLYDYEASINQHRFEPTLRLAPQFYLHLVAVPSYLKKEDEAGAGLAWRKGERQWLAFYGIAQSFDHNLSLKFKAPGPGNDPFEQIPLKLEIDGRLELSWARIRFQAELGSESVQELYWPDSAAHEWVRRRRRSSSQGRLELKPFGDLWVGSRFSWVSDRTHTRWPVPDTVNADTLLDRWIEPFLSWTPTPRLELSGGYRLWRTDRDMDSVTYYRDYDILTGKIGYSPWDFLHLEVGYQRAFRFLYNNDTLLTQDWPYMGEMRQSRLLLNCQLRFASGLMVVVKEGIEMDRYPRGTFEHPHNHTYLSLYMPLAFFKDNGREND